MELRGFKPPRHGLGNRKAVELALEAVLCSTASCRASVLGVFIESEILPTLACNGY